MKKISTRILALLAAMTMLLVGCSESDSSGSDSKKAESSSQSQTESSSDADSSDSADEGDDSTSGADVPDVIPWDYDVPDPSGNTKPQEDSSQSSSDSSSQSSSDSSHKQSENTTAAPAATTAKQQTTAAAPRQTTAAPKATTKAATAAPKPTPAPSGTPVQRHGALHISGNHIVDSKGQVFMLQGMSTHGIMWEDFSNILSANSLKVLRDDWKCNAVRIAMYTEEWGGYTTGSSYAAQAKQKVISGVAQATNLGMYVIIDWHILKDGNPQKHQSEAIAFFTEMANRYKNQSNVIFELCNEPNGGVSWASNIKPYCQAVVSAIRKTGANNLVICGTGTWSQDIHQVVGNKLSDSNCAYTLHFYANTHTDWLRRRLQQCYNSGLPVLVTEFGTCDASGNGGFNESQTRQWYSLLSSLKVGWFNWSACGKAETASAFRTGTNLSNISAGESQLTQSGKLIRTLFRANAANAA
ncbi:MAG: glycoside hydrolase family 5 protein [Ruminococcus sp.]|nr:glycoside hydrolase family 5 protein [Ruminococcus sp.]